MQRYNSASSLSSQASLKSGLLFSTPLLPRKNYKSDNNNKTRDFFRKQSSGPSNIFSNIYINNTTSTPCDFIRKRERTRSSLYAKVLEMACSFYETSIIFIYATKN